MNKFRFVFFGTPDIAVASLEALAAASLLPALIVTRPDERAGRGRALVSPPVKTWAEAHGIEVLQPRNLDDIRERLDSEPWDVFVLVAYGKILPQWLIDIPAKGVVNMHPSLLPRLRGPSPIRSAILSNESPIGVSVMLLDDEMDHGPILAQRVVTPFHWPLPGDELDTLLSREGGLLLAETLPDYLTEKLAPIQQEHGAATYCQMIEKKDAYLSLSDDPEVILRKIYAYAGWPVAYTYFLRGDQRIRTQILSAHIEDGTLVIDTVKPEGKTAIPYDDFVRSGAVPEALTD